jgi:hypothetical protein
MQGHGAGLPEGMNANAQSLTLECWAQYPTARPSCREILRELEEKDFAIVGDDNVNSVPLSVRNVVDHPQPSIQNFQSHRANASSMNVTAIIITGIGPRPPVFFPAAGSTSFCAAIS